MCENPVSLTASWCSHILQGQPCLCARASVRLAPALGSFLSGDIVWKRVWSAFICKMNKKFYHNSVKMIKRDRERGFRADSFCGKPKSKPVNVSQLRNRKLRPTRRDAGTSRGRPAISWLRVRLVFVGASSELPRVKRSFAFLFGAARFECLFPRLNSRHLLIMPRFIF